MNAVHHARTINREIRLAGAMDQSELFSYAKQLGVPVDLLRETAKLGRLPVVNFAAGGLGKKIKSPNSAKLNIIMPCHLVPKLTCLLEERISLFA